VNGEATGASGAHEMGTTPRHDQCRSLWPLSTGFSPAVCTDKEVTKGSIRRFKCSIQRASKAKMDIRSVNAPPSLPSSVLLISLYDSAWHCQVNAKNCTSVQKKEDYRGLWAFTSPRIFALSSPSAFLKGRASESDFSLT
jgi:hypothetical protein